MRTQGVLVFVFAHTHTHTHTFEDTTANSSHPKLQITAGWDEIDERKIRRQEKY